MMEKFSFYEFEIKSHDVPGSNDGEDTNKWVKGYFYVIYNPDYVPSEHTVIREADEYFDSENQARLAAIGHISLLENGEG